MKGEEGERHVSFINITVSNHWQKLGVTCFHTPGCPPEEPFLLWAILDREITASPSDDLPPDEFKKASQRIRDRMGKAEVSFSEWLEKQKRKTT